METVKVPFGLGTYKNVDEFELRQTAAELYNGYVNENSAVVKRPGLDSGKQLASGNNGIDGFYWWKENKRLFATHNGKVYLINLSGGAFTSSDITNDGLTSGAYTTFDSNSDYVFAANGGRIVYFDHSGTSSTYIADADCPTAVTHIRFLDGYLIANSVGTQRFYWSEVDDPLDWRDGTGASDTSGFASAVGATDNITAIETFYRQLFLFGPRSVEIWENDGETPFVRLPGGFIEVGCVAPYSVVKTNNALYWLDDERKLVRYSGKGVEKMSTPYDKIIQTLPNVSDCIGNKITIEGKNFIILTFPEAGRTFVINYQDEGNIAQATWSEWNEWDSANFLYNNYVGRAFTYCEAWGCNIVGARNAGQINCLTSDEVDDNGTAIRFLTKTGHVDHGTSKRKRSRELRVRVKRGTTSLTTTPKLLVRWRDDNKDWSNERQISLGNLGETESYLRIRTGGAYQTRQWEFSCSDDVPLTLLDAEEDIDLLR